MVVERGGRLGASFLKHMRSTIWDPAKLVKAYQTLGATLQRHNAITILSGMAKLVSR